MAGEYPLMEEVEKIKERINKNRGGGQVSGTHHHNRNHEQVEILYRKFQYI